MSVCGQSGQTEDDSGSEEVTATAAAVRDIYKQKPASKVVRVLTVLAYLLSVSLAAILLSVYYVCVWRSPELPPQNDTGAGSAVLAARRDPLQPSAHHQLPVEMISAPSHYDTGGGDSGVSEAADVSPASTEPSMPDPTTDTLLESTTDSTFAPDFLNSTYDSGTNDTDVT